MCLERKVDIRDWTHFVPVVQATLNHTPVLSLATKAPVELFCVLPAASPLDFGIDSEAGLVTIDVTSGDIDRKQAALRTRVQEMHRKMQIARSEQTQRNQNMQRGARKANFDVGDYVLRSRVDQKYNDKLLVTWIGPYQVVGTDEHSFRHLVTDAESDVHASCLKFYADESFEITEEILEHVAAQGIVLTVAEFKDQRWNSAKRCYKILVEWKGLEPIEDSWKTLKSLYKDIPVMAKQFEAAKEDAQLSATIEQL
ncbi:LOW QUALITY PROTEIN: hypothetical protein PHMEG_00015451 [Phytophthora megakarya]|uniref:Chromo domain-containing protein n=1 Tax=Phytophthora megakarya TaxID=4795 RepID=A0A225W181_9STRA|nr:LOW QUALITY PROTEIN: hypothetical protein PHMEG_00015451 [Phytophthora megakarya]